MRKLAFLAAALALVVMPSTACDESHTTEVSITRPETERVSMALEQAREWKVVDLGRGFAKSVNNNGATVGHDADGEATLWTKDGTKVSLGYLNASDQSSIAYAINQHEQVVGISQTATNEIRAFLWEKGSMQELPVPAGVVMSHAFDISNSGVIAGWIKYTNTDPGLPVVWVKGVMRQLPLPDGTWTGEATGITSDGQILGRASWPHQYGIWRKDEFSPLPDYDGMSVTAHALNERGHVVGDWVYKPMLLKDGVWVMLETLGYWNGAYGINNKGQVVGISESQAVVWNDGALQVLGGLSPDMNSCARGISDTGIVVGDAYDQDGQHHAVMWLRR